MADYFVTNVYTDDDDNTIHGGGSNDRLTYSYTIPNTGVTTGYFSGGLPGGYSGLFDGSGSNNAWYSGMEHLTFLTSVTGNDNIRSGDGNDSLMSGAGNDTLSSGGGHDTIDGGSGVDYWNADRSADATVSIDLNGVSTLTGGGSVRNMEGFHLTTGTGHDSVTGFMNSTLHDWVSTGDGDDLITMWSGGTDEIHGGLGNDRLVLTNALGPVSTSYWSGDLTQGYSGLFDGPGGANTWFYGIENFTYTDEAGGADVIRTGDGNDSISTALGNDTINSGGGVDTLDGGEGTDYWQADLSGHALVNVNLNEPSTLEGGGSVQNMEGFHLTTGAGNDSITGHVDSVLTDRVYSGAGDDLITMWVGNTDEIHGGAGEDRLVVINDSGAINTSYWTVDTGNGGYNGLFDGPGGDNMWFYGIDHFTYTDLAGENDRVRTGYGNDSVLAGDGNDTLNSAGGDDTLDGGAGTDYWIADLSGHALVDVDLNEVSDFEGNGTVRNMEGFNLTTGDGDDRITGHREGALNDRVAGGEGDDLITMWTGGDNQIYGGPGDDRLVVTNEVGATTTSYWALDTDHGGYNGLLDGPAGNNTWFYGINHFTYTGTIDENDNIRTGDGNDSVTTAGGNDIIHSGGGHDTVDGGAGTDFWYADRSADDVVDVNLNVVSDLTGGGSVRNMEGFNITAGAGNDSITGFESNSSNDFVYGGDGDDLIRMWMGGTDEVRGQGGSDRLVLTNAQGATNTSYWSGNATDGYSGLFDGPGAANTWFYGIEHFTYTDEAGENDNLRTGAGDDSIASAGGNDTVNSNAGDDTVDGGAGIDFWLADRSADALVDVNLNETSMLTGGGSVQNMEGFNITTGNGNDSVTGHTDSAFGDYVNTGSGDDLITMWMGNTDEIHGGAGSDQLVLTNAQGAISTSYWSGNATDGYSGLYDGPGGHNTWFYGIESFVYDDEAGGSDTIRTGDGDDSIAAGAGNDTILSGAGDDTVDGGAGTDRMVYLIASTAISSVSMDGSHFYITTSAGRDIVSRNVEFFDFTDMSLTNAELQAYAGQAPTGEVVVTGTPEQGQTLIADSSTLDDADGLGPLSYQWLRDGAEVTGATGDAYGLGQEDVGTAISVRVSYVDGSGTPETVTSSATTDIANVNDPVEGAPVIIGDATQSETLSVDTSRLSDPDGMGPLSYQWLRDGADITGATGDAYGLGQEDVGTAISVRVSFVDGSGTPETVTSSATTDIVNVNDPVEGAPVTTGDATQGETLSVDTSGLSDPDGLGAFSYQWLRDGADITGATGDAYGLGQEDVGTAISVRVSYVDGAGTPETVTSIATTDIANVNDPVEGTPVIAGDATQGETLSVDTSGLSDPDGLGAFSYQWLRDGADITGATSDSYILGAEDADAAISVRVAYTDGQGTAEAVTSAATDPVMGAGLHLIGTLGADRLDGGVGDDTLEGLAGPDRLNGQDGDDSIFGGDGVDTLIGGEGDDMIVGGDTDADLRDVVYGGGGHDSIDGGYGNDELRGDAGNDTIAGGFGADTVIGGTGNDTLTGSAFADQIFGSAGDDFVNGGFGHDLLNGGSGGDRFFHIGIFDHGSDWIQDYNAADGDVLHFGNASASISQFQVNTTHTATAAGERSGDDDVEEAFVIYRPTGQIMWALVDGGGQSSINLQIGGDVFDLMA
ncbi:hypothetical protein CSC82_14110 [Rhodobacteraceae bacterium 4F10]|nr:hypothetical protein CSC82_14110 [Rhodobacteraceae bacterium 4F10]